MKKLLYLLSIAFIVTSCSKTKDYITLQGKISGKQTKKIHLQNSKLKLDRVLRVKPDGTFKDTLKVEKPTYFVFTDGTQKSLLYLKNGDVVKVNVDAGNFTETISFSGKGTEASKYLAKKNLLQQNFFNGVDFEKSKDLFDDKLKKHSALLTSELKATNDSLLIAKQSKFIKSFEKEAKRTFEFENYLALNLPEGTEAPDFSYSYENPEGESFLLEDFRGKYVYLKFWATWCMQCRKEAPYFKKLAEKYKDKNIKFISVSIDQQRALKMWKKMALKSPETILELYSDEDEDFKEIYKLKQIPRFMLIDPDGNIISANAPVPSSNEITKILEKL